jgi:hypothetical protein
MADDDTARRSRQRLDAFLQRVALIGEREFCAMRARRLRDAPRNRPVVGDAQDQAALACHQPSGFRHKGPHTAGNPGHFPMAQRFRSDKAAAQPPGLSSRRNGTARILTPAASASA